MMHIITSNSVPVKSIYRNVDNFMVVDHYSNEVSEAPLRNPRLIKFFNIYKQDEMELLEDYRDTDTLKFSFNNLPLLSPSIEAIADSIVDEWRAALKEDELADEPIVVCACNYSWNRAAASLITKRMQSKGLATECMNLYDTVRAGSTEALAKMLRTELGTEFIYPDDPVSFAYAIGHWMWEK